MCSKSSILHRKRLAIDVALLLRGTTLSRSAFLFERDTGIVLWHQQTFKEEWIMETADRSGRLVEPAEAQPTNNAFFVLVVLALIVLAVLAVGTLCFRQSIAQLRTDFVVADIVIANDGSSVASDRECRYLRVEGCPPSVVLEALRSVGIDAYIDYHRPECVAIPGKTLPFINLTLSRDGHVTVIRDRESLLKDHDIQKFMQRMYWGRG